MIPAVQQFTRDISKINLDDACSSWQWRLKGRNDIILVSDVGDLFVLGEKRLFSKKRPIMWLNTRTGTLTKVANDIEEFQRGLEQNENLELLFLRSIVEQLRVQGIKISESEVYSCKLMPSLGGTLTADNFEPSDVSVHFAFTGQIHQQIKDLPAGTRVNNIKLQK